MKIDITYHCSMGCTHCLSDCRPDGRHMRIQVFRDALLFAALHASEDAPLIISGGEPFEHPDIPDILDVLAKAVRQRIFPAIAIVTNGARLVDDPVLFAQTKETLRKGKGRLFLQVTNDPRFYPRVFTEKERRKLLTITPVINTVEVLSPAGRALRNFPEEAFSKNYPSCGNVRLVARQTETFRGLLSVLQQNVFFCTPTIGSDGLLRAGESALCPPFGSIHDSDDVLRRKILAFSCDGCPKRLCQNLAQMFDFAQTFKRVRVTAGEKEAS